MAINLKLLGDKLRRYRSQFELSLEEVSQATGIPLDSLESYEEGQQGPTGDQLLILADLYKCDYKILISEDEVTPLERTDTLFRRFGTEFNKRDRWSVQEFLFLCESEQFLQQHLRPHDIRPFSFTKVGTYFKGHAKEAGRELRRFLGYSDNAVPRDIYHDFRTIGIHVFRRRLDNSNISGLYVNHPFAGDCVLINYSEDVYRQRFTAAHEAAHAIFDREDEVVVSFWDTTDLKDVRANTFASHYLMPPAFLRGISDSTAWDETKLVKWAHDLRVNTEPLLIALSEAGLITGEAFQQLKSTKVPLAQKVDPELPETLAPRSRERKEELLKRGLSSNYVSLCFEAYHHNVVTASRLVELLLLDGDEDLREIANLYNESLDYGD